LHIWESSILSARAIQDANAIIASVMPHLLLVLLFSIWLAACNKAPENREAVRQGIIEHLSKNTGLDLKAMDVDVKNVNFQGNKATATVAFKPKQGPDEGMSMNYSLERQGTKWIVQKAAGSAGHGGAMTPPMTSPPAGAPAAGDLPAGHPPVSGTPKGGDALPPGHPPVESQPAPSKK
jgi:hypothetical protein